MGLFSSLTNHFRPYGWDSRADGLPGEQIGILMEMERQIKASQERDELIQRCAELLLAGDRRWTAPLACLEHFYGRSIEHAAIAEAFKTLKGNQ